MKDALFYLVHRGTLHYLHRILKMFVSWLLEEFRKRTLLLVFNKYYKKDAFSTTLLKVFEKWETLRKRRKN